MTAEKQRLLIYPSARDPRWVQLAFLLSFVFYAISAPRFSRTPTQWVAGMLCCLVLDFGFSRLLRGVWLLPMSGLISSMGLLLLCDSPFVWPYVVCGALAISSKHLIRFQGKHIFNPLNFGIVCGLLFLSHFMTVVPSRWGGELWGMAAIAAFGVFNVTRANRLDLSATYVLTFVAGVFVRSALTGAKVATVASPMTGASFQLFTFFMISDPMTTPETRKGRIVYAFALAVLDHVLRHNRVNFATFFALFIMCGLLPIFRRIFVAPTPEVVWKPTVVELGAPQ